MTALACGRSVESKDAANSYASKQHNNFRTLPPSDRRCRSVALTDCLFPSNRLSLQASFDDQPSSSRLFQSSVPWSSSHWPQGEIFFQLLLLLLLRCSFRSRD